MKIGGIVNQQPKYNHWNLWTKTKKKKQNNMLMSIRIFSKREDKNVVINFYQKEKLTVAEIRNRFEPTKEMIKPLHIKLSNDPI